MDGKMRKKSEALGTNLKKLEHVLYELTLIKAGKTTPVAKVCLLDQFARTQGTITTQFLPHQNLVCYSRIRGLPPTQAMRTNE